MKTSEDQKSISTIIQNYFSGYLGAEAELVSQVFHPETNLFSVENEKLDKTTMLSWLENIQARKKRGDLRQAISKIDNIDVTGDAAMAKVTLAFPKYTFTDYLSLLKIEGSWRIVGKIYTMRPQP